MKRALQPHYDFVVCGSGTSDSVLARRLAENHEVDVLLLEAGCVPAVLEAIKWPENLGSERDWGFRGTTNPQINGRTINAGDAGSNAPRLGRDAKFAGLFGFWKGLCVLPMALMFLLPGPALAQSVLACTHLAPATTPTLDSSASESEPASENASPYDFPVWKTISLGTYKDVNAVPEALKWRRRRRAPFM